MSKRTFIAIAAGLAVGVVPGVASADGGNGASFCSESGRPVRAEGGPMLEDPSTFGNAGELISFGARNGFRPEQPGQVVKFFCNPSG